MYNIVSFYYFYVFRMYLTLLTSFFDHYKTCQGVVTFVISLASFRSQLPPSRHSWGVGVQWKAILSLEAISLPLIFQVISRLNFNPVPIFWLSQCFFACLFVFLHTLLFSMGYLPEFKSAPFCLDFEIPKQWGQYTLTLYKLDLPEVPSYITF